MKFPTEAGKSNFVSHDTSSNLAVVICSADTWFLNNDKEDSV